VVDAGAREAQVIVPDYQLSLAIGKEGQNARLAARLTGWRIDIRSDAPVPSPEAPPVPSPEEPAARSPEGPMARSPEGSPEGSPAQAPEQASDPSVSSAASDSPDPSVPFSPGVGDVRTR